MGPHVVDPYRVKGSTLSVSSVNPIPRADAAGTHGGSAGSVWPNTSEGLWATSITLQLTFRMTVISRVIAIQ